jgi:TonB family protein
LQRYGDQLNSRLNRAWIKPTNLVGVGLVVTVVFDVSSSGRISNIRLRPASGNPSFDASVKAAFTRVSSGGVTPTGQGHSFTMSFKMVD